MDRSDIDIRFTYHPPTEAKITRMVEIREKAKELAYLLNSNVRDGREQSLAVTHLEDVVMWANAGIAREGV